MALVTKTVTVAAHGPANLFDLSTNVGGFLAEVGAGDGRLTLLSVGSTGAIIGLPARPGAHERFIRWVMSKVPFSADHRHPGNAFAHLRSTLLKSFVSMAVAAGETIGPDLCLLENTAGRKRRPIALTWVSGSDDMTFYRRRHRVEANGWIDLVDITRAAAMTVRDGGVNEGQLCVSTVSERTAVVTIENDTRLLLDTADFLANLVNGDNKADRSTAGDIGAALLGPSVVVPIESGRPALGVWQQLMLVDFAESGEKELIIDLIGSD